MSPPTDRAAAARAQRTRNKYKRLIDELQPCIGWMSLDVDPDGFVLSCDSCGQRIEGYENSSLSLVLADAVSHQCHENVS